MRSLERDHKSLTKEQRFLDMNRQIREVTSIVKALTEKMTNYREENDQNDHNFRMSPRSDMVTGVSANSKPTPTLQQPHRTPLPTPALHEARRRIQSVTRTTNGRPNDRNLEFVHKLTEQQKLNYFQSLLRDDAVEVWQTLKTTNETTLINVLQAFNKEYAKNLAKLAYRYETNDIAEIFLFAKIQIQLQKELAMAGEYDATIEVIKTFVQRRCQYA